MIVAEMAFWDQVGLGAINNVVLGSVAAVVIGTVTHFFNRSIEKYKLAEALASSVADVRIKKMAEVWEAAYAWESRVVGFSQTLQMKLKNTGESMRDRVVGDAGAEREALYADGRSQLAVLSANRFWIGERLYAEFARFYESVSTELQGLTSEANITAFHGFVAIHHVNAQTALGEFVR